MLRTGGGSKRLVNAKYHAARFMRGKGIEIGSGMYKAFPQVVALREPNDPEVNPPLRSDVPIESFEQLGMFEDGSLDFALVWDAREADAGKVCAECARLLKVGGHLIVAGSMEEDGENQAQDILIQRKTESGMEPVTRTRPEKSVCVVRYGAFGDMLQTSALLPELKRQGYHVTLVCQFPGSEVIKHDPHVDEFWVHDQDQVPNNELFYYWRTLEPLFDRFINLCESVEGTLLCLPGRANHRWPQELRHAMCNYNYGEFAARIAQMTYTPEGKFYPTDEELKWANDFKAGLIEPVKSGELLVFRTPKPFLIVWSLAGSSVHKFYPHMDGIISVILKQMPDAHIALVGEPMGKMLEAGWESEPRVHCLSGEIDIRRAMSLAQVADVVVGPETGVLNSVAFESNAKVVFLSHSTNENLTKHWVNTTGVEPQGIACYPCHRLHYNRDFCPEHKETGASVCQAHGIHPSRVFEPIREAHEWFHKRRSLMGVE